MISVHTLSPKESLWADAITYAASCSWEAGPLLAHIMRENQLKEWERVFVATENDKIVGFCDLTEKDELSEGYGFTPFIGFVFVDEKYRGMRISEKMIDCATSYAKTLGYEKVYIMSGEKGFYEKYGFALIGEYPTIYEWTDQLFVKEIH